MHRVSKVEVAGKYRLSVEFEDGAKGEVDLSDRLFGPVFEPLKEPGFFARAAVDEFGAITWPNGADIAPDALHEELAARATTK